MAKQTPVETQSERSESRSGQLRPQELEKYPEQNRYKEVPENRRMEAQFREKTGKERILGLPRVEGFDKSGVITDKEVGDYLKNEFPERHVNNISMESVRYNDRFVNEKGEVELAHWEERELGHGTQVIDKNIVVNRQTPEGNLDKESLKGDLAHEVGHQVHNGYLEKAGQDNWLKLSGDRPEDRCVSDYARTSPAEDFAESYRSYISDPENLRSVSREKYAFMQGQVFEGREYGVNSIESDG